MFAGYLYLFISIIVFALKMGAAQITQSTALFSDALETLVNIAAAGMALIILKFVSQPKDDNHPYGHGKAEFISSAVEGGLVVFAGLAIIIEAVKSLSTAKIMQFDERGLVVSIVATGLNLVLAFYLKKTAVKKNSALFNASSVHLMSDVWTTVGVLLGLGIAKWTGLFWIDGVIAIVMALFLFKEGYHVLREAFSGLTDELDPKVLSEIAKAFQKVQRPGLIDLHHVRFIRSGHFHHVDAHLVLPRFWDVKKAHSFTDQLEAEVVKAYKFDGEIAFHVDPCDPADCSYCDLMDCPVRSHQFVKRKSFTPEEMIGEKKKME